MAINFPDPNESPWYNNPDTGGNGVTYEYTAQGYWRAVSVDGNNAIDIDTGDARYVEVTGDTMTGILTVGGNPQSAEVGCKLRNDIGFAMACAPANGVAFGIYEEGDTQRNCSIYSDGRATFASIVSVNAEGKRSDSETIFAGYNSSKSVTSTINGDGSATFSKNIQAGGNAVAGAQNGAIVTTSGFLASSDNSAAPVFRGYTTGNATPTSQINASGLATFRSTVKAFDTSSGRNVTTGLCRANSGESYGLTVAPADDENNFKAYIKADGSAFFYSKTNIGPFDLTDLVDGRGIEIRPDGNILIQRRTNQSSNSILDGRLGNVQTTNILANGSATFAGTIEHGKVSGESTTTRYGLTTASGGADGAKANQTLLFAQPGASTNVNAFGIYHGADNPIFFKYDGSAEFKGQINGLFFQSIRDAGTATCFEGILDTASDPPVQTCLITADGAAKFASGNTEILSDGAIRIKRSIANGSLGLAIFPDNDFSQPATAVINTDGTASFKNTVTVDVAAAWAPAFKIKINGSADDSIFMDGGGSVVAVNFNARAIGASENAISLSGATGSATFTSSVNVNRADGSTDDGFAVRSGTKKRVGIDAAGDIKLGDDIQVANKIYLKGGDGSATFAAGNVELKNISDDYGTVALRNTGGNQFYLTYAESDVLGLTARSATIANQTQPIKFNGETGSATFAGDITAGNVTRFKTTMSTAIAAAADLAAVKQALLDAIAEL